MSYAEEGSRSVRMGRRTVDSRSCPRSNASPELAESKRWLEDVIGEEVRYMAAPRRLH